MPARRASIEERLASIRRRPSTLRWLINRAGLKIEFPCSACGDPDYDPDAPVCERCKGSGALLVPKGGG